MGAFALPLRQRATEWHKLTAGAAEHGSILAAHAAPRLCSERAALACRCLIRCANARSDSRDGAHAAGKARDGALDVHEGAGGAAEAAGRALRHGYMYQAW